MLIYYPLSSDTTSLFSRIIRDGVRSSSQLPLKRILELCEKELGRLSRMKAVEPSSRPGLVDNELTITVVGIQSRLFLEERIDKDAQS